MFFSSATGVRCWSRPWRRPTTTMNSVLIPGCWEAASDASLWQPPWLTKDLEDFSELYWCHLAQPQVGAASMGIVLKWRYSIVKINCTPAMYGKTLPLLHGTVMAFVGQGIMGHPTAPVLKPINSHQPWTTEENKVFRIYCPQSPLVRTQMTLGCS